MGFVSKLEHEIASLDGRLACTRSSYLDEMVLRYRGRWRSLCRCVGCSLGTILVATVVSCGPNVPPTYATDAGNCIHFIDDSADEYVAYLADVRRVTGCSLGDLRKCSPPIKLEIIEVGPLR